MVNPEFLNPQIAFKFNTRNQKEGESFKNYLKTLKQLIKQCHFGCLEDTLLRDRIICGVYSKELQRNLLQCSYLDLYVAITVCINWDEEQKQQSALDENASSYNTFNSGTYSRSDSGYSGTSVFENGIAKVNFYKSMDKSLECINEFVTLKSPEKYVKDFEAVKKYIIAKMQCEEEAFSMLYGGPILCGSFADGVRVKTADEFDLNIALRTRLFSKIEIEVDNHRPGYVTLNFSNLMKSIANDKNLTAFKNCFSKLIDAEGYLLQNKFHSWIEGIMTRILNKYGKKYHDNATRKDYTFAYHKSGPAHTLEVWVENRYFSIDFVPALCFDSRSEWVSRVKYPNHVRQTEWQVIAKPIKNVIGDNRSFLTSYHLIENGLIYNKNSLKQVLRLVKKMRDNNIHLVNLKSYYIKTAFLWMNSEQGGNFWKQPVGYILICMLERLLKFFELRKLPFYWDDRQNMFDTLGEHKLKTMHDQLKAIHKVLTQNCATNSRQLYRVFLNEEEMVLEAELPLIQNMDRLHISPQMDTAPKYVGNIKINSQETNQCVIC